MRGGKLMTQNGAATFRIEETMNRMALRMGAERLETYATPTGLISTVYSGNEHRTQIVRINRFGVDMNRVLAIELMSRKLSNDSTPADVAQKLTLIESAPQEYTTLMIMFAVGAACGGLAYAIGGGIYEVIAATVAAAIAQWVRIRLIRTDLNPILVTLVGSAIASLIAVCLVRVLPAEHPQFGVIASVLLFVPGVPLVTSIIDLSRFDLNSGVARGVLALLHFVSIALGMLIALTITGFNVI